MFHCTDCGDFYDDPLEHECLHIDDCTVDATCDLASVLAIVAKAESTGNYVSFFGGSGSLSIH